MNTRRVSRPSASPRGGWGVTLLAAGVFFGLFAAFFYTGFSVTSLYGVRSQFRLPQPGVETPPLPTVSVPVLQRAFAIAPLDQGLFSALMVMRASTDANIDLGPWLAILKRYGWRDTPAVQNMMIDALRRQDLKAIVTISDALMRQNDLVDESAVLMRAAESYPATSGDVIRALQARPSWRGFYLSRNDQLDIPLVLEGRLRTLTALQASGDRLVPYELAPEVGQLVAAGRFVDAEQLWRYHARAGRRILQDPDFKRALSLSTIEGPTFPFDWQFESGTGYVADIQKDGLGGARVTIDWDGRGVPVFLSQRTSALPGRYRLLVKAEGDARVFGRFVKFRLQCESGLVDFEPSVSQPTVGALFVTPDAVKCAYPNLLVQGRVQTPRQAVETAFTGIVMERIGE